MQVESALNECERRLLIVPIERIDPPDIRCRSQFPEDSIRALAESIRRYGLLSPILVRAVGNRYQLIAGERRLRAMLMLGMRFADAFVENVTDLEAALMALIENIQREPLSYLDEAEAYRALMRDYCLSQRELAVRLGRSQGAVANRLRLLGLSNAVRGALVKSRLTERHARALLRLKSEEARLEAVRRADEQGLSVRQLEALIERMQKADTGRVKLFFRDERMFVNTVLEAVKALRRAGVNARSHIVEREKAIDVVVTLPKIASRRVSKGESPSGGRT